MGNFFINKDNFRIGAIKIMRDYIKKDANDSSLLLGNNEERIK
jgi:hypothetical protein